MTNRRTLSVFVYLILLIALSLSLVVPRISAQSNFNVIVPGATYGDQNTEPWSSTISADLVQAYVMFSTPTPLVIQSVSMYVQYSGSDGTQCMRFGIYLDNGNGSPAGQPLVAATWYAYCFHGTISYGPAWETWRLRPLDFLNITQPGTYWLAVLASQTYGDIFHSHIAQATTTITATQPTSSLHHSRLVSRQSSAAIRFGKETVPTAPT